MLGCFLKELLALIQFP